MSGTITEHEEQPGETEHHQPDESAELEEFGSSPKRVPEEERYLVDAEHQHRGLAGPPQFGGRLVIPVDDVHHHQLCEHERARDARH